MAINKQIKATFAIGIVQTKNLCRTFSRKVSFETIVPSRPTLIAKFTYNQQQISKKVKEQVPKFHYLEMNFFHHVV